MSISLNWNYKKKHGRETKKSVKNKIIYSKKAFYQAYLNHYYYSGRRSDLKVNVLDGSKCLGLRPGQGHCVVSFGKTLCSHSASVYPGI